MADAQALEPVSPVIIQVSLNAKRTSPRRVVFGCRYVCFTHRAPHAFPPKTEALQCWDGRCLHADLIAVAHQRLLPCGLEVARLIASGKTNAEIAQA